MPKNEILESIRVEKLIFGGKGLGVAPDGRKVIISGGVIPGSVIDVRILKARKSHYEGQQIRVVEQSPIEIGLQPGHQMYGGAKWLTIGYEDQLRIKSEQVREAFYPILKYLQIEQNPPSPLYQGGIEQDPTHKVYTDYPSKDDKVASLNVQPPNPLTYQPTHPPTFHPIIPSPEIYGYRNKVEFSWGKYISAREGVHDEFRFGFHAQGQFDRIEDCTYCALADEEVNAIFQSVNTLSRESGLPTYDPKTGEGFWRHLVIRQGKKTGEIMIVFSVNSIWKHTQTQTADTMEFFFTKMVGVLHAQFSSISSIYFLENAGRADIVTGNPVLLSGKPAIEEELLGMIFEIQPKSFFQVNTLGAERLYGIVVDYLLRHPEGNKGSRSLQEQLDSSLVAQNDGTQRQDKVLLDLYAGTGTIGILLSKYFDTVYSVELVESASRDGERNAMKNNVKNVEFVCAKVEDFVKDWESGKSEKSYRFIRQLSDDEFCYILKIIHNNVFNKLNIDKTQYVALKDKEKIIGFVRIWKLEEKKYEISNLWIDKKYRGKKLGHKLIKFLYSTFDDKDSEIYIANERTLNPYYTALGFHETDAFPERFIPTLEWAKVENIPYNVMKLESREEICQDLSTSAIAPARADISNFNLQTSKPTNQQTRQPAHQHLTIVLDPPRDGMHSSALPHILSFGASEIIYVSCNPATLARDLEVFIGKNRDEKTEALPRYYITDVTPVDMFPHTHHIETVVRMERR